MIGVPNTLARIAAVMVTFLVIVGGALPAAAHGSQSHQITAHRYRLVLRVEPSDVSSVKGAQVYVASVLPDGSQEVPRESSKSDCCCGSLMCHAGVTAPATLTPFSYLQAERMVPEPSVGREKCVSFGLERPPRSLRTA